MNINTRKHPSPVLTISVSQAARIMAKSDLFVRIGMQRGELPIGQAYQMPGSTRWTYYISPAQFAEYLGLTMDELREAMLQWQ